MKNTKKILIYIIGALFLGLGIGWLLFGNNSNTKTEIHNHATEKVNETIWTCSMHPQIRKGEPGKCPICGMDLIPLSDEEKGQNPLAISMSPTAMQLAGVETWVVGSKKPSKSIRLSGKVQADERRLFTQTSHIPGRIEELSVNFTGEYISKGQIIAHVYSPELTTAQDELLEAQKISTSQPALFQAAKAKLKNWKLTDRQIEGILSSGKPVRDFPVLANSSGYVLQKYVNIGDHLKMGQPIFEIADLSKVWLLFDVYEQDIQQINKGDKVDYTVQSLPGKNFEGKITYLDPVINPQTRVAKARVEVINKDLALKPEMFVNGIVATNPDSNSKSLMIPKSAVMWTGKRSVVYVKNTTNQGVSFIMREITLGPALGDGFIVESGLQPGEEIATNGTFSIDAAAQLAGKPSMMNPKGGSVMTGHNHGKMVNNSMKGKSHINSNMEKALKPLFDSYFNMKNALAEDDFDNAKKAETMLKNELNKISTSLFEGATHEVWMEQSSNLKSALEHIDHFTSIDEIRKSFIAISNAMINLAGSFRPLPDTLYVQHCPMADTNNGADWLSREKEIVNPYFGALMISCGEVTKMLK